MADGSLQELLGQLNETLADARLSDEEKRSLVLALREAKPPEEGLRQLRNRAFALVRERLTEHSEQELLRWLEGVVRALEVTRTPIGAVAEAVAYFSPGQACRNAIQTQLRKAQHSVDICVFTISDDQISREIVAAHQRGVRIRLITDNEKEFDAGSDIGWLRDAGIAIVVDRTEAHMHHKFALFDGSRLLNGSYNWTRSAADYNEENLVLSTDLRLIRQFADTFDSRWQALQ